MSFDSWIYALFLPIVLLGYYLLSHRAQNVWLLAASCVFYGWWDWRFLGLMAFTAMLDFWVAIAIDRTGDPRKRRRLLLISLVANLGVLAFFKYLGFFAESAAQLLAAFGLAPSKTTLDIVLPIGISFYTFQTMSYTIEVYRRAMPASRDPIAYGLFVSFFPHLVAGPIMRATSLLPQVERPRTVTNRSLSEGCLLLLIGFFKKVVMADPISAVVDATYGSIGAASTLELWRAAFLFAFQIYLDFSGYSDIARGSAKLMGFELMENFRQPFFADSLTDLWRRWHISLSTWLRDYLYFPLGGNRGSPAKTIRNILVTMTLSGLWHGARWTFVIWGFLNGLVLSIERLFLARPRGDRARAPQPALSRLFRPLRIASVFVLFSVLFVFFRAPDFPSAWRFLAGLWPRGGLPDDWSTLYPVAYYGALVLALDLPPEIGGTHAAWLKLPRWCRSLVYAFMLLCLICWSFGTEKPFIYFQF